MSDFDDDLIADALRGRAGGGDLGVDGALDAVIGRAAATRRRRAAVAGMGAMTGVVVVAALAFAGGSPDVVRTPTDSGVPSDPTTSIPVVTAESTPISPTPATGPSSTSPAPQSTTPAATLTTTTPSVDGGATPTNVPSAPPGNTAPGSTNPPNTTPGSTNPPNTTPGSTNPPNTTSGSTSPPNTAPGTTNPPNTAPGTSEPDEPDDPSTPPFSGKVYSSAGGSITVSWNGSSLSLGGVSPAVGFTSSIEDQRSDRIRVRFEGSADWRIEVRADSQGVVTSSISS